MKITCGCLMVVLICSCKQGVDNGALGRGQDTMERQHEVRKVIGSYFHTGIDTIRGPLTVREVEDELDKLGEKLSHEKGRFIIVGGPLWDRLKAKLKRGDELYFYRSDKQSWAELHGWAGYVAIRESTVIDVLPVTIN